MNKPETETIEDLGQYFIETISAQGKLISHLQQRLRNDSSLGVEEFSMLSRAVVEQCGTLDNLINLAHRSKDLISLWEKRKAE